MPISVVTGGSGFLGSHLTDRLLKEGHEVIAVDHFLPGCPPSAERIRAFLEALLRGEPPVMEGQAMLGFG